MRLLLWSGVFMADSFPTDSATLFLVCEIVRQEPEGKVTLIGVFTAGDILVPLETALSLPSLGILFVFKDGEGKFSCTMSMFSPSGHVIIDKIKLADVEKQRESAHNLVLNFSPFQTAEFGTFRVVIQLNDRSYERTFQIKKDPRIH
jgi:hypothetical protein